MRKLFVVGLLVLAAACDRGGDEVPPEIARERFEASRRACLSAELAQRAEDDVRTLEASIPAGEGDPAGEVSRQVSLAALTFARAYQQHADLRAAAYAQTDSAVNYADRTADSLRYARAVEQFATRAPERGTLEANVLQAYEQNFAALLADADHPCNWDLEEAEG